jgi:hypothetical protein
LTKIGDDRFPRLHILGTFRDFPQLSCIEEIYRSPNNKMEKEGQYVGGNVWEGTGSGRGRESIVAAVGGCLAESVKLGCLEGMTVVMSPTT